MLREGVAAAYQRKDAIKRLRKGHIVFLYSNDVGIVGCGTVAGPIEKRIYSNRKEAHLKKLNSFFDISESPVSIREIRSIYGQITVIQALFELPNYLGAERLYRECLKRGRSIGKKAA